MALRDRTKNLFADIMEDMLKTTPLEDIRVIELCKRCDATPQAFYYHFRDKYELTAWIFLRDFLEILTNYSPKTEEALSAMIQRLEDKRTFYQHALQGSAQSTVTSYILDFNVRLAKDAVMRHTGSNTVTKEQLLLIKYHNYGLLGLLEEWLSGNQTCGKEGNHHEDKHLEMNPLEDHHITADNSEINNPKHKGMQESDISIIEITMFNKNQAPDFLQAAFQDYPYPSTEILHRLGK